MEGQEEFNAERAELEELRRENAKLRAELQTAGQNMHEFLALLVHDIRNPLAAITSGFSLLQREKTPSSDKQLISSLVKRRIATMGSLLDDVLASIAPVSSSSTQQGGEIVLDELITRVVESVALLFEDTGSRLTFSKSGELPHRITGDTAGIEAVMVKLLCYAAYTAQPGSDITMTLGFDGTAISLSIPLCGNGIRQRFAKQAVEALGGSFRAESGEPGKADQCSARIPARAK